MRGAVSGRVAAATPVRPACASRSLGRLALVALTCLPRAIGHDYAFDASVRPYPVRVARLSGVLSA